MRRQQINPDTIYSPTWQFSQAVKVTGGSTLYLSGIMGLRRDGSIPDSVAEQAEQAFSNLKTVVEAGGATMADIVKITVFVGSDYQEHRDELREVRARYFPVDFPASTLVQVAGFADPRYRIEVEAVAVFDG